MQKKDVYISGRTFSVAGRATDRYFSDFLQEGMPFSDPPIAFIEKYLSPGATVLDVGANIGVVCCSADAVGAKTVHAFEASPSVFECLRQTVGENSLHSVIIHNVALSDHEGVLSFVEDPDFLAGSRAANSSDAARFEVPCRTLDAIVGELDLGKIDLIKIDVEGHERAVLNGAVRTLETHRPVCLIELNSYSLIFHNREVPQEFLEFLTGIFPRLFVFNRRTGSIDEIFDIGAFLQQHLLSGLIDDLIGAFGDLPPASDWFKSHSAELIEQSDLSQIGVAQAGRQLVEALGRRALADAAKIKKKLRISWSRRK